MAGWHTRLWRRVKVAPGVTINLSKSGPSLSVGPRGSKVTFGRRGVRQTVGLPGTGLYMSRQLTETPRWDHPSEPDPATPATSATAHTAGEPYEIHYGMPLVAAIVIGVVIAAYSQPAWVVIGAGILAFVAGLLYEALAAHHPLAAKVIAQVVVAIAAVVTLLLGIILVLGLAGVGASSKTLRRS